MKITKGQLKRIIAEEHALVYGTRKPGRRRVRKSNKTLQERRLIASRKKEILIEAKAELIASKLMTESWLSKAFAGIKGALGSAGEEVSSAIEKVTGPITKAKENIVTAYHKAAKIENDKNKAAALIKLSDVASAKANDLWGEFSKELAKFLTSAGFSEKEVMIHIAAQSVNFTAAGQSQGGTK